MTVSRRIIMQKARRHPRTIPCGTDQFGLRPLVGMWFQVHYPPLVGVLPIFRSRYLYAIGRQGVLSLARWTSRIQACFHVSGPTQVPNRRVFLAAYGTITLYGRPFQNVLLRNTTAAAIKGSSVLQPHRDESRWFRLVPVRSPLLRQSLLLSFPRATEMFQFAPFATYAYGFSIRQVGHPGINTRLTAPPGLSQSSTPF